MRGPSGIDALGEPSHRHRHRHPHSNYDHWPRRTNLPVSGRRFATVGASSDNWEFVATPDGWVLGQLEPLPRRLLEDANSDTCPPPPAAVVAACADASQKFTPAQGDYARHGLSGSQNQPTAPPAQRHDQPVRRIDSGYLSPSQRRDENR